eukprot:SAG25_NODE_696_length_5890_cov_4.438612_6_plen_72_part_00
MTGALLDLRATEREDAHSDLCWGMPAAFIQPVLYYCNYYDHYHQGHLMATQMNASGLARRGPTLYPRGIRV